jgi:pimeloyl-ACP methyl ester carboxylesterase
MLYEFEEKDEVVFGKCALYATMTIPKNQYKRYPAILLVGGSGRVDRNGNIKHYDMNVYKELAHFFAGLGFVTLRYDKRGVGKSQGSYNKTGLTDLVDDVILMTKHLEEFSFVDRNNIILLGHSEGCVLTVIANTIRKVAGLILLTGAGVSLKTVLMNEVNGIIKEIKAQKNIRGFLFRNIISDKRVIAKEERFYHKIVTSDLGILKVVLRRLPAKWVGEHEKYNEDKLHDIIKDISYPTFVAVGDKDAIISDESIDNIFALQKKNFSCHNIKNMDHILREHNGDRNLLDLKKHYLSELGSPTHPELIMRLDEWCREHFIKL